MMLMNTTHIHIMQCKLKKPFQKNPKKQKTKKKTPKPSKEQKTQAKFVLSILLPTNYSEDQNIWLAKIFVIVI